MDIIIQHRSRMNSVSHGYGDLLQDRNCLYNIFVRDRENWIRYILKELARLMGQVLLAKRIVPPFLGREA